MTATSASVRFGADGAAKVQSYVRLTASTYIRCCTYDDAAPILTIQDGPADITITNPGRGEVTEEDVTLRPPAGRGRDPVRGRAGEARRHGPRDGGRSDEPRRAGGVMATQMEAGRLELVPPAAPGFSPACTKEVTRVCARS